MTFVYFIRKRHLTFRKKISTSLFVKNKNKINSHNKPHKTKCPICLLFSNSVIEKEKKRGYLNVKVYMSTLLQNPCYTSISFEKTCKT